MTSSPCCVTHTDALQTRPSPGRSLALGRSVVAFGMGLLLWSLLLSGLAPPQPLPISPEAMQQIQALVDEKAARSPAQQKMDSNLLLEMKMQRGHPIRRAVPALHTGITMEAADTTLVDIT